jgi:hypothetical protein
MAAVNAVRTYKRIGLFAAIKHSPLKRHIDEVGKILLDENRDTK